MTLFLNQPSLTQHSYSTDERYEEERQERKAAKRHERNSARHENDEYVDDSEDEYAEKKPKMLEAPSAPQSLAGASYAASSGVNSGDTDFVRDNRERRRDRDEREPQYMSGGLGRRD
ncbi:hypothetical protein LTR97_008564 [Elasticomyces elasticus]|uniref:Uncharacterized protein n=1 Tax=Elasticomyces elasticus TaxID=574655 RepID=A0AAN7W807_9PEZI|nr:hypothetical protein LTR97_008564 [Elasticomyces elasticus]